MRDYMKKNILFVMPSLAAGGGEKSLVNLLSQIDYSRYNVDLFLLNHEGLFMEFLPKYVRIVSSSPAYQTFSLPFFHSMKSLLLNGEFSLAYHRMRFTIENRKSKITSIREQSTWKYLSRAFDELEKEYDVAIGFLEKTATYFCVDKVKATKKIGWVHIDYDKLGMDSTFDRAYFNKLNHIITVSEECAHVIKNRFPEEEHKVEVIYNIVSPTMINNMAQIEKTDLYNRKENEIVILSIGRLHRQKGFELAIEACKLLIERGKSIHWYIIGEGEERESLTHLIQDNQLEKNFTLLGLKSNPYPYIQQADLYVQPSRFEGKSIAIDEAKILNKPIIVTNYSTAKDQIQDRVNGLIVDMNSEPLAEKIQELINNSDLKKLLIQNLKKEKLGTEEEIKKLYKIL